MTNDNITLRTDDKKHGALHRKDAVHVESQSTATQTKSGAADTKNSQDKERED